MHQTPIPAPATAGSTPGHSHNAILDHSPGPMPGPGAGLGRGPSDVLRPRPQSLEGHRPRPGIGFVVPGRGYGLGPIPDSGPRLGPGLQNKKSLD